MGGPIRLARALHLISAFWALMLALLIFGDVAGRILFSSPIPGTKELLQNSVVSIAFLQIPLAVYSGSMLRTSIFADACSIPIRKLLRTFSMVLGFAVFMGLMWSAWPSFLEAYQIGEYEGEGALRVPTWPVRGALLVTSAFSAFAYLSMIYFDWTGQLVAEETAPGIPRHTGNKEA